MFRFFALTTIFFKVPETNFCVERLVSCIKAQGVLCDFPASISSFIIFSKFSTAIYKTIVPQCARYFQSREVFSFAGSSWPVIKTQDEAYFLAVRGIPEKALAAEAAVTPGTISKSILFLHNASNSSEIRLNIEESPFFSRITFLPCFAFLITRLWIFSC